MRCRLSTLYRLLPLVFSLLLVFACSEPAQPSISFYRALQAGDINQVERHLYWGVDVNQVDANGNPPLHLAAKAGRIILVRMLLDKGAAVDAANSAGQSTLAVALIGGRTQIAELLVQRGAEFDPSALLREAARNQVSDRDVIGYLVAQGGDINQPGADGDTALHLAVRRGYRVVARNLIARGADVNAANQVGETPLAIAQVTDNQDIVKLLQRNGALVRLSP